MSDLSRRSLFGLLGAGALTALGIGAAEAQPVVYGRPMPPPRVEVVPGPRAGFHWVPGHWVWRRGWVWVPGRWGRRVVRVMPAPRVEVMPARPYRAATWVKGHWAWSDRRGDWVWVRGRWVR